MPNVTRYHECADCPKLIRRGNVRCLACELARRAREKTPPFQRKVPLPKPVPHPSVVVVPGLAGLAEQPCPHEWVLGEGYETDGYCKRCGEVRRFSPHWAWVDAHGKRHLEPEWNQEVFGRVPERPASERILYYEHRTERI